MPLPRRPLKHLRRAIFKALRHRFPSLLQHLSAERQARHMRDLRRLRAIAASRRELQIQITYGDRFDGAGGQALSVISALAFADNHHCRYLHTPFQRISHVEGDVATWTRRWEEFFGFGHGEREVPADAEIMPLRQFVRLFRLNPSYVPDPRMVAMAPSFGYGEFIENHTFRLGPRLRTKYYSSDKSTIPVHRRTGAINVAIHVRRGDVGPDNFRYVGDAPILNTIAALRAVFGSMACAAALNVFSEGAPEQFQHYVEAGCSLHLNTDTFETFHNLVAADLLVTAPSAFSRVAAMLSDGIVLTPTMEWGVRDGWLTRALDGTFDQKRLTEMLTARAT